MVGNLTQEDAEYIMNVIWPRREGMINATRLGDVLKYANIVADRELSVPGCSCEYRAYWGVGYDIISQNLTEIEKIANPVIEEPETIAVTTSTRGRKKK